MKPDEFITKETLLDKIVYFLKGTSDFTLIPGFVHWLILIGYLLSGVIGLLYVFKNGSKIIM
jgi:hypothetical protein